MTLKNLNERLNEELYINENVDDNNLNIIDNIQQSYPYKLNSTKENLFSIKKNQLVSKEKYYNVINNDNYIVILYDNTENNFNGTLKSFFYNVGNLKLKSNIEEILFDVFLVGGGSSGSSLRDPEKGIPIPGQYVYKKNIKLNKEENIKIQIGKGGEEILPTYFNRKSNNKGDFLYINSNNTIYDYKISDNVSYLIDEIINNPGENSSFLFSNNKSIIAKGGQKNFEYDEDILNTYDTKIIKNISIDLKFPYGNGLNIKENWIEGMSTSSLSLKSPKRSYNLSGNNIYIPYTNIEVCKNGFHTTSLGYFIPNQKRVTMRGYEYYSNNKFDGTRLFQKIYNDDLSYGSSGYSAYVLNHMECFYASELDKHFQELKSTSNMKYDFYRSRIGKGASGVCAMIVRSDYFEY